MIDTAGRDSLSMPLAMNHSPEDSFFRMEPDRSGFPTRYLGRIPP